MTIVSMIPLYSAEVCTATLKLIGRVCRGSTR